MNPQITQINADKIIGDKETYAIIGAAMAVHSALGHGFLKLSIKKLWNGSSNSKESLMNGKENCRLCIGGNNLERFTKQILSVLNRLSLS